MFGFFDYEYELELLRQEEREEGREEGRKEGSEEGQNKLGSLMIKLRSLGRENDAFEAAADPAYREKLYQEFQMA